MFGRKFKDGKYYFALYKNVKSSKEYNVIEKVMNSNDGVNFLENEYIKIEYHNVIGLEKAKMLISIFEQNSSFYKYFLKKFEKIVISNNCESVDKVIVIDNMPTDIFNEYFINGLIERILPQTNESKFLNYYIIKKINGEQLLQKDDVLSFLRSRILKNMQIHGKIDYFRYVDLMDGKFVDNSSLIKYSIIEVAFKYSNMEILDNYLNGRDKEKIEEDVYWQLVKDYNILLFNESLKYQDMLLDRKDDQFLSQNILPLFNLFAEKVDIISKKYKKQNNEEKIILNKEEILGLVNEFFDKIDSSGDMNKVFMENLQNGTIKLWDSFNQFEMKEMYDQYKEFFNIYGSCVYTWRNDFDEMTDVVMNVPLQFTIDDVRTIVHEFIHLYSGLKAPIKIKTEALSEFLSIYYEILVRDFLFSKGYTEEQLAGLSNFRVIDSFSNFYYSAPIVFWLNKYNKSKNITYEEVMEVVKMETDNARKIFDSTDMNDTEIENKMVEMGYYKDLGFSVDNLLYNLNNLLLLHSNSIIDGYPYILASILTYECMENGIDNQILLDLMGKINLIDDPSSVMSMIGIDLEKYGFEIKKGKSK